MREVWLRGNVRVMAWATILPGLMLIGGCALLLAASSGGVWLRGAGWALSGIAGFTLALLALQARQPRLACDGANLLVYVRAAPTAVPLEVVEAFFLGRGPSHLPARPEAPTVNLIVRLAQKATDWADRQVSPLLGCWREGYITLRGAWCEPLTVEVANRLNHQLAEAKRHLAAAAHAAD